MLSRIRVAGFKSLTDVRVELPRLAVLIGPNAAGKSNLLDAFQVLARIGTERTLADVFDGPIRGFPIEAFALPSGGLPALLRQPAARFEIEADLQLRSDTGRNGSASNARYRVAIAIDPDTGVLSVRDEYLAKLDRAGKPKELPRVEQENGELVIRRRGSGGRPPHESLGGRHTLLSDTRLSGDGYPLFDQVRSELRDWRTYYLDPGTRMRTESTPRDVRDIGVHGEHLAEFLYGLRAQQPKSFDAVARALRTVIPSIGRLDVDLDIQRGKLDIQIEQDGTMFSSRIISEGTLRVLALCAIAVTADRSGLIAFEEPENGVSPQRIDRIAGLLVSLVHRGAAQLIVTTHSPSFAASVLDQSRANGADVGLFACGRDGAATTIRRLPDPGLFVDRTLDELLAEPAERDRVEAVLRRGWLDG